MKKFVTFAAVAALATLAACSKEAAPTADATADATAEATAVASDEANAQDPNLTQVCDSQTPTAACDAPGVRR